MGPSPQDPCHGKIKTLAVVLHGCQEHKEWTRWKRHCSLQGQWLLCDEDIEFLATLELPERPEAELLPHVAVMVDTSYRPHIQHYVVHNVRNNTWPSWGSNPFHAAAAFLPAASGVNRDALIVSGARLAGAGQFSSFTGRPTGPS